MISMGVLSQQFAKSLFCSFNNALQRIDGVRNGPLSLCLNRDGPAVHCTRMHAMPCISGTFSLYLRLHSMLLWYEPRITTKEPVSATTTTAAHGISVGAMRVRVCGPRNEKKKKYNIRGWWDEKKNRQRYRRVRAQDNESPTATDQQKWSIDNHNLLISSAWLWSACAVFFPPSYLFVDCKFMLILCIIEEFNEYAMIARHSDVWI